VVGRDFADYTIQWYNGTVAQGTPASQGDLYSELDAGLYTTTATDVTSKCISAPVTTEILSLVKDPEFDLKLVPTNCEGDVGQAIFVPLNDVVIKSVEWFMGGQLIVVNDVASDLPKGDFKVKVTTDGDCSVERDFTILPEILAFNGVSQNGDGQNDHFEISCIQDFPNNTVKIFNRAGTLVYQAKGYNNQEIAFSGTSNEGLSLMGRELPEGTYFYIIDKGDGSRPKTGYLELLRN